MKMRFLSAQITLCITVLALPSTPSADIKLLGARSESSPNPIASQYPNSTTGTVNGTVAVVPIPYTQARSTIPAKYNILTNAYKRLLPGFPEDSYPVSIVIQLKILS